LQGEFRITQRVLGVIAFSKSLPSGVVLPIKALQADVKARGKLICGTLGTAEPFSFQDPKTREIVGYDIDMCRKVAESLGVTLELKPMAVEARIPELLQGRVDMLAANLGWSKERAQQIDYSYSYFVSEQKVMVAADSGITTLDQLAGKKVSALKGSSSEQGVRRVIPTAETVSSRNGSGRKPSTA
jgi:polar amino acid transport system substrate-binding protein